MLTLPPFTEYSEVVSGAVTSRSKRPECISPCLE
jgi:hypothetical protein